MNRRPGVTLLEVLITIFIMGIGMLALLTLFPLGALNMARALQDDRVAAAANNADHLAVACAIRQDPAVVGDTNNTFSDAFSTPGANGQPPVPWADLTTVANYVGPSHAVYIDPIGSQVDGNNPQRVGFYQPPMPATTPITPGLPRRSLVLSFLRPGSTTKVASPQTDRWFTFLDDVTFTPGGAPDTTPGGVQRLGRYSWAYVVRRPNWRLTSVVELSVVVYAGRATQTAPGPTESTYPTTGAKDSSQVVMAFDPATQQPPPVRAGTWILDSSQNSSGAVQGYFYRVTGITESGPNQITLDLQTPLKADVSVAAVMEMVVEVLDRGTGWQP